MLHGICVLNLVLEPTQELFDEYCYKYVIDTAGGSQSIKGQQRIIRTKGKRTGH